MQNDKAFQNLLQKIHIERGLDFTQYRPSHLRRRIDARVRVCKVSCYSDYAQILDQDPGEYKILCDSLLIHVTEFFRNMEAWQVFKNQVLPEIIQFKKEHKLKTLRVWSAGSCSGEETYSVSILFSEYLGAHLNDFNLKVIGTDIDVKAIHKASMGEYEPKDVREVNPRLLKKYFHYEREKYVVNDQLRLLTQFRKHNIVTDRPLSHIDLLICRNVSIYFSNELKDKIYQKFYIALKEGGFLMIGMTEVLPQQFQPLFQAIDNRARIYRKI